VTTGRESRDKRTEDEQDSLAAASFADAAVRRALLEARQDLKTFLRRRLNSNEEAEEVLQRFSVRALERASDLRDVRTVRGWLGRVLASTIVDHQRGAIRKRRREVALEETDVENVAADADVELDAVICNCLYKLLPTLKPDYADVIWRADILGEPRDRIAASLGTTLNNVTVRIHRGRQALKKRLEEMCLTCPVHGFLDCRCDAAELIRRKRAAAQASLR
jgi:RNA polymerase sigma-70 factor (ECF subfamily)